MINTQAEPNPIKVGILISYDASLALTCLRQIYSQSDKIVLAIDKDRRTWSGDKFVLPELFLDQVTQLDVNNKIEVYEDDFSIPGLAPIDNDTRERRLLADRLGPGGWHVQVDADEYFIDFSAFVAELRKLEDQYGDEAVEVRPQWVTLFKQDETGFFLVHPLSETFAAATNRPDYLFARNCNEDEYHVVRSGQLVLHQSWARTRDELEKKISAWGHRNDFDGKSYLRFWDSVSLDTCRYISNFHPIYDQMWMNLSYFSGTIDELIHGLASGQIVVTSEQVSESSHEEVIQESPLPNERFGISFGKRLFRKVTRFLPL